MAGWSGQSYRVRVQARPTMTLMAHVAVRREWGACPRTLNGRANFKYVLRPEGAARVSDTRGGSRGIPALMTDPLEIQPQSGAAVQAEPGACRGAGRSPATLRTLAAQEPGAPP